MKTSKKLLKAFEQFRPHINGHKTAMDLFFEAVNEVESMQEQLLSHNVVEQSEQLPTREKMDEEWEMLCDCGLDDKLEKWD